MDQSGECRIHSGVGAEVELRRIRERERTGMGRSVSTSVDFGMG